MLKTLVSTALQLRGIVVILAIILLVVGFRTLPTAQLDVFPEFAPPLVEIQTEAPGLSTTEVESLVSEPIENAMNGLTALKTLRSKSVLGLSAVVLIFEAGTDLLRARQLVQERLALAASRLPTVARPPVILSPLSSTSRVMKIGLSSNTLSQMDMTDLARWTIRPRLMAVPGVANVAIWGERDRQLQVIVDPDRLRNHNVTLDAVIKSARDAVTPETGGFIDTPNQRLSITNIQPVNAPGDMALIPVQTTRNAGAPGFSAPLRLGDVATVRAGFPQPIGDAVINDKPGLLLIVEKQPEGNTLNVTRQVEAALEGLKPGLGGIAVDTTIFRPATFIETALGNLNRALLLGCVLVVAVLALFLFDWRTAFISLTAIPLSLVAAGLALYYTNSTVNTMVLAGLILALGEVVDDAIIDVENIQRRLALNRLAGDPEPPLLVVLKASLEVRSAIVYATLIVALMFLPVFLLDGLAGSFFRPLALSYVLAVLASLVVALTLTPARSLLLLPRRAGAGRESPLTKGLKHIYRAVLPAIVRRWPVAMAVMLIIFMGAAAAVPYLGEEFFPEFRETDFLMHWVGKPGTSLDAMTRSVITVSKELRAIPGVRNFGSHIGRAEVADEVVGPNFTELWISIDPRADYDKTIARIHETVNGYPGLFRDVLTYLKERTKEVLTGAGASIVVRLYGPNLDTLRAKAAEIQTAMNKVPGVINLKLEQQVLVPQVEARTRAEALARFGLTPGDVRRAMATFVKGQKVGEIHDEQKVVDVVVQGEDHLRTDLESLRAIRLDAPGNASVRLGDVVELRVAPAPNLVQHENNSRRLDVTCDVSGRDLGSVAREVEAGVRALHFERGYHPEFPGEFAARQQSRNRLLALSSLSLLGILMLLYTDFKSARLSLLVFLTFLFALVGGVAGAFASGGVLSLGSLIGFVTVLGIAARNGIMLVSHYRHLETEEGQPFDMSLILRGAEERLAPILMTAAVTALALAPIALGGVKPGQEIEHPMAAVILGGLVTSTILNLFLLPALYWRFGRSRPA
ncbi:MAG: efflux RND transporter permease subunit [Blastocatellia bacterium]